MKIIIIDNDNETTKILMEYFHENGHAVAYASTVSDACILFANNNPVATIVNPIVFHNKLELLQAVVPRYTKLVLMTFDRKIHEKSIKADYYLDRPFNLDDLDDVIEHIENSY